jgi:hypothetical protein
MIDQCVVPVGLLSAPDFLLDAAETAKALKARVHIPTDAAHDKKSKNTKGTGAVKKGGGGGKFTWGSALTDSYDAPALDSHDPNYDSDEDRAVVYETKHDQFKADVEAFKQQVRSCGRRVVSNAPVPVRSRRTR